MRGPMSAVATGSLSKSTVLFGVFVLMIVSGVPSFGADVSIFAANDVAGPGRTFTLAGLDITQRLNGTVSIATRIMPNYLSYRYFSGDTMIRASAPGLFAVAGIKLLLGHTTVGMYGGVDARKTTLKPDIDTAKARGKTLKGLAQGEIDGWYSGKTNLNIFASYSGTDNFFYEKTKVRRQITNENYTKPSTLLIGIEQFVGRNADYQSEGVGGSFEVYFVRPKVSIGVRGGFMHDSAFENGPYWGLLLYKGF